MTRNFAKIFCEVCFSEKLKHERIKKKKEANNIETIQRMVICTNCGTRYIVSSSKKYLSRNEIAEKKKKAIENELKNLWYLVRKQESKPCLLNIDLIDTVEKDFFALVKDKDLKKIDLLLLKVRSLLKDAKKITKINLLEDCFNAENFQLRQRNR